MILRIGTLAMIALILSLLLKQWKSDFLPLVRIAISILFAFLILSAIAPLIRYLQALLENTLTSEYASLLFKALGLAILTQICAEICKESGEGGIASAIELIGKIEILVLALPLINDILALAKNLIALGH